MGAELAFAGCRRRPRSRLLSTCEDDDDDVVVTEARGLGFAPPPPPPEEDVAEDDNSNGTAKAEVILFQESAPRARAAFS